MNISHHLGQSHIITCYDITASTSQWQRKSSLNIRTSNIRDSCISPTLKELCRSVLSEWKTRTVKMERDYTCQERSVNITVQSSFGLWMRWCVAIIALEQWPQGSMERQGESNQLSMCNGGRDWAVPELPGSPVGVWIDCQCLQEMDGAPMNNSYNVLQSTWAEKWSEVKNGYVCLCHFFSQ